ncbi:MAG: FGGY family carbohydrate kinase [Anaerolineae bacterium]|nr:FGGY family carbohydrate kinase [Anaerolineae bacterium]MDW8071170.1 FGGY family carbohydrate kinase [Anaerolineae bacterium]
MPERLLGLDVGTTATKGLVFDLSGEILASASQAYGLLTPQPGWVEQSPDALCEAVAQVIRAVLTQLRPEDHIAAVSLSSQGGTTIPVDAAGHPTYNAISWMDQRGAVQAERVRALLGDELVYTITGWPLQGSLPLQHIAWLRDAMPDCFARSRYFLFVNDFIGYWLTGERCMDPTNAGITQLMNIATGDWDERLLEVAGIRREQLSPIQPCGTVVGKVTAAASAVTGLVQGTPLVNGAHDQYCAAVGAGVLQPGQVLLSCGTAWVLLAVPETREAGLASRMAVGRHAVDGCWGAIRSLGGVGRSLEWLVDLLWEDSAATQERTECLRALDQAAARAAPGADGLFFYPLAGGHAATYGPTRGAFIGLTLTHGRGDLTRAVMEGITFELRWALEEIEATGVHASELTMVGGAARSVIWPRLVADITGRTVRVPASGEAASRGAAILAGRGAGLFPNIFAGFVALQAPEETLLPDRANVTRYTEIFTAYRRGARFDLAQLETEVM